MDQPHFKGKVGLFVAVAIALLIALVVVFSKGATWLKRTYELRLRANTVSGLKSGSVVLMSGVPVGTVAGAQLAPDGKGVIIRLKIEERFTIYADAQIVIEQIGFLGDQYVAIYPRQNVGAALREGDIVPVQEPFSFTEMARAAGALMEQVGQTVQILSNAVGKVDQRVLSEATLTNFSLAIANFRQISERVLSMVEGVNRLVETNSRPVSISVSNMVRFSEELDLLAVELRETFATNRYELTAAVKSLQNTGQVLERLAREVESGRGVAGSLIKDEKLQAYLTQAVQNMALLTSNLNKYGLLYKPRPPKTNAVSRSVYRAKDPFQ